MTSNQRRPGEYIITDKNEKFYLGLIVNDADQLDVIYLSVIKKHLNMAETIKRKLNFIGYEEVDREVKKIKLTNGIFEAIIITLEKIPALKAMR